MPLIREQGDDLWLTDDRDYAINAWGHLRRDPSGIAARLSRRLLIRRGEWLVPTLGSRLHEIKTLTSARRRAEDAIREAWQDLIDSGAIVSITVGNVEIEHTRGYLAVPVAVEIAGRDGLLSLGTFQLGT